MTDEIREFRPDWTVHPGVFLRRILSDRHLKPEDLCLSPARMHLDVVQGIIDGTRPVDQDAAVRLANGTGVPSSFWLDAQTGYDADLARGVSAGHASPAEAPHVYVSTACFHGNCGSCRSTCKYCDAPCSHNCHPADLSLPKPWVHQARDIAVLLLAELGPDRVPAVLRERIATDPDLFWLRRPDPGRA